MPRGGRRSGAGRKPGSQLAKTAQIALHLANEGTTPLEFVLAVMRDDTQPLAMRVDCAKAALPHMHPRLAHVHQTEDRGFAISAFLKQVQEEKARINSLPLIEDYAPQATI
jgi:hypothetical protein